VFAVLAHSPQSRLTLLLGDGETLWATTRHHSLSALVDDEMAVLASEPYDDDPRWRAIPEWQLVTARPGLLSVVPLDAEPTRRPRRR
jgi:glutamine amidotransferase